MPQYLYKQYNPGQYPGEVQAQFDDMSAAGWHVHTALPAYNEIYILWERDGTGQADESGSDSESKSQPKRANSKRTDARDGTGSSE